MNDTAKKLLEYEERSLDMSARLLRGAARIRQAMEAPGQVIGHTHTLRDDQTGVFGDFVNYINEVVETPSEKIGSLTMSRLILPPRTGKTVVAAAIISGAGFMCTFIVPTKVLVIQTAAELRKQLPGVPVGTYYSDAKDLVLWGVNVTTYSMLASEWRKNTCLPTFIAVSSLVFADEGHHAMTPTVQEFLSKGFDALALRCALTATPNYNEQKMLEQYFARLIREITLYDAVQLNLFAHLNVVVEEVDVDGSQVEIKKGDFDPTQLGEIMSEAPLFKKALDFRYQAKHRRHGAIYFCKSRRQAYLLQAYLIENRPKIHARPELIVGETIDSERDRILEQFELTMVDTIINVGVLTEGWNTKRCKVLVDLGGTMSLLQATQEYFRILTKDGDEEAHAYILVPRNLKRMPVLPHDLLTHPRAVKTTYLGKTPPRPTTPKGKPVKIESAEVTPVKHVEAKSKTLFSSKFTPATLDKDDVEKVRALFLCNPAFQDGVLPKFGTLRHIFFLSPEFSGSGENLVRYLGGEKMNRDTYPLLMVRYFPENVGDLYIRQFEDVNQERSCTEDATLLEDTLLHDGGRDEGFVDGWLALGGPNVRETESSADEQYDQKQCLALTSQYLKDRELQVVLLHHGLGASGEECSFREIGHDFDLSLERIRQIYITAINKMRRALLSITVD